MSVRGRILDAGTRCGYPAHTDDLLAELVDDDEAILVVQAMTDTRFVNEEELATRLDDALGMPTADPAVSALEDPTEWRDEE